MSEARVMEYYDRVADAPDAVEKLRGFVLELAVRGKLVEQRDQDEPAATLLAQIQRERSSTNGRSAPRAASSVALPSQPLPRGWAVTNFENLLLELQTGPFGSSLHQSDYVAGGTPVINPASLVDGKIVPIAKMAVSLKTLDRLSTFVLKDGDIVLARRGEMGRSALVTYVESGWLCGTGCLILRMPKVLCASFIVLLLGSPQMRAHLGAKSVGATMQNLNQGILLLTAVALPPAAEQHRIVAKVDELMALCDRLEAARAAREAKRERFTVATLGRLTSADSEPSQFREDARFALDSLALLVRNSDDLALLRQSILELGVRGKLVAQRAGDGVAAAIDPAANELTKPFDVPSSWTWARLAAIGVLKGGGTPSKARDDFWNGTIPWVSPRDMKQDYVDGSLLSITDAAVEHSAVSRLPSGTLLFVVRGMILAHSFPVALSRREVTINQDMKALVPSKPEMAEYLLRALKALKPIVLARVQRSSHGTGRIEGADYQQLLIPVPPIREQVRIVERIDELMRLCDRIERSLQNSQRHRSGLLEASLSLL
jgi:type I restriction enzyme S subunit